MGLCWGFSKYHLHNVHCNLNNHKYNRKLKCKKHQIWINKIIEKSKIKRDNERAVMAGHLGCTQDQGYIQLDIYGKISDKSSRFDTIKSFSKNRFSFVPIRHHWESRLDRNVVAKSFPVSCALKDFQKSPIRKLEKKYLITQCTSQGEAARTLGAINIVRLQNVAIEKQHFLWTAGNLRTDVPIEIPRFLSPWL